MLGAYVWIMAERGMTYGWAHGTAEAVRWRNTYVNSDVFGPFYILRQLQFVFDFLVFINR